MKSTLIELGGFACVIAAAWMLSPILGVLVLGLVLLFIGYLVGSS